MSKYCACESRIDALAAAHVEAVLGGKKKGKLYGEAKVDEEGMIEFPDSYTPKLSKLKLKVRNTKAEARANKIERAKPKMKDPKPGRKTK